jgi:hypothetical protein
MEMGMKEESRRLAVFCLIFCYSIGIGATGLVVDIAPGENLVLERRGAIDKHMRIDGHLKEEVWRQLPAYDEFVVIDPDTLADVPHATQVQLFYSSHGLYVGVDMVQPAETLIMRLSGRDQRFINRDSVSLTLDTSGEGRYGYWFGIYLGDSLIDGTVLPERQFSRDWDGAWRGASQQTDNGWSAEFFIPWGIVAMPKVEDSRKIGLYMSRKVAYKEERWGWPALPRTKPRFLSVLQPLKLSGVDPKQQYSIYPFTSVSQDRIDDEIRYQVGADFFWRPSTNFQATATLNPDFGNVESDQVVINLTATETFFPEKRLFFLEGQEVFSASPRADTRGGGIGLRGLPVTLLNTRRIGGKPQSPNLSPSVSIPERELLRPVDLLGAVKATGQAGRFRYGLLGAFEDQVEFNATAFEQEIRLTRDGSNYGVARLLYEDSKQGAYRGLGFLSTAAMHDGRDAMAHSVDLHYLTPKGKLKVDTQLFMSNIDNEDNGYGGFADFEYTFRKGLVQRVGFEYFDEHVDINDLGFLGRNNAYQIRTAHKRTSSDLGWARSNAFDARAYAQRNTDGFFTQGGILFANQVMLNNLTQFTVRLNFFPESYDDLNSFGNGIYRIEERINAVLHYDSANTGKFSWGGGFGFNEEHLGGDTYTADFHLNWRPTDRFSVWLSATYQNRDGWLLHQEDANFTTFKAEQWEPEFNVDYFISARQRFRVSLQWIGIKAREKDFYLIPPEPGDLIETSKPPGPTDDFSFSQLSFQLRYRWEIAPLSDLYVVYTRLGDKSSRLHDASFSDVFTNAFDDPIGNLLVFKIRYRFGS